jgi:hemolysin activation/secretion protein
LSDCWIRGASSSRCTLTARVACATTTEASEIAGGSAAAQAACAGASADATSTAERAVKGLKIVVKEIRLVGNTAFTDQQLSEITSKYTNRELTTEDLESLRLELTMFYINHGYVTSGAIIPDQPVTEPVITVRVIEGKLTDVNIEGNKWFRSSYFENRLRLSSGPPLNANALQERLQILQANPRVERINAELRPGRVRGESALDVRVKDANPFKAWLEFNNFLSPAVGAEQGAITLMDQNLLGLGDTLSLQYGASSGVNPILNFSYSVPVTARDTTLSVQYRRFHFKVVEDPFEALDITNQSQIIGVMLRQPLYRTPRQEFGMSIGMDYEENKSFLQGEPFPFIAGAANGVFRLAVLRFGQDWVQRGEKQIFSALSRFSVGIGALGSTTTPTTDLPDGRFFSWLGEAQWLRQLDFLRTQLVGRGLVQLSNDHLFPLEQISVGGRYSVRGYRAFTLIRDNATIASLEARVPIYRTDAGVDTLFIAPFVDFGHGWQTTVPNPTEPPKTLASVGIGAIWNFWQGSHFEVYWGQQLNHFRGGNGNLQDHGVYLQLIVQAL